jgi:type I restriction enzyme S subunit
MKDVSGCGTIPLGRLVLPGVGLSTGPFGSQLSAKEYRREGIPVVMPRDLVKGSVTEESLARVSPDKARELERHRLEEGDIVLARRGVLGRCALVGSREAGWLCGTGCLRIRSGSRLLPAFLLQHLRSQGTVRWLTDHAVGQTMPNLNKRTVSRLPLWVPERPHQRLIAEILAEAEASVGRWRHLEELEERFQRAMAEVLTPREVQTTRPLGALCRLVNGNRFKAKDWSDQGQPIIRTQNLHGSRQYNYFAGYSKPAWKVAPGDLLLVWSGTRKALGPHIWRGPEGVLNQHIFRVEPVSGVDPRWLYEALSRAVETLAPSAQGFKGSLVHLRKRELKRFPIDVPPAREQARIADWSRLLERRSNVRRERREQAQSFCRGLREKIFAHHWVPEDSI